MTRSAKSVEGFSRRRADLNSSSKRFILFFFLLNCCLPEAAADLFAQDRKRPPQMALDRVERHIKNLRNLYRIEVFLVSQLDDQSWLFRQRRHDATKCLAHHRIWKIEHRKWLRCIIHADGLQSVPACVVNASVAGYSTQPEFQMGRGFDRCQIMVETEEYILCQFLGRLAVVQEVPSEAEDHCLI